MKPKASESGRLGRIWYQWTATRTILRRAFRLDNADCAFFIAAAVFLFLLQVEKLFWTRLDFLSDPASPTDGSDPMMDLLWADPLEGFWIFPFGGLTAIQTQGFWWGPAIVYCVNAWILSRWLSRLSGRDAAVHGWLLKLRWLFLGIPWLGLAIFPAWQALINQEPRWAFKKVPTASLQLDLASRRRYFVPDILRRVGERLATSAPLLAVWLVPVNLLATRMGLAWLNHPERTGDVVLWLIGIGLVGLHYLGFVCLVIFLDLRSSERRLSIWTSIFLGAACCSWFLPMPLPVLSCWVFVRLEGGRIKTTVYQTLKSEGYPAPIDDAAGEGNQSFPWLVRLMTGYADLSDDSITRYKLLKFYRAKTFLLILDAASMMLLVVWLEEGFLPSFWMQLPLAIPTLLVIAWVGVGGLLGFVGCIVTFSARFFRSAQWKLEQDHHPVKRYLLLTSLAFLSGVTLTDLDAPQALATSMLHIGFIAFMLSIFYLLPAVGRYLSAARDRDFGLFLWPAAFQGMAQLGLRCRDDPMTAEALSRFWGVLLALTPLWALLLFTWRGRWLMRPFSWRDIFDRNQPLRVRRLLALKLLTAALPLGGLAIPFWIRARRDRALTATAVKPPKSRRL